MASAHASADPKTHRHTASEDGALFVHDRFNIRGRYLTIPPPSSFVPSKDDQTLPTSSLLLDHIYGYQGKKGRENLFVLPSKEAVYFIAVVVVLYNIDTNTQRFYTGHDNDITSMTVHPSQPIIASGQIAGPVTKPHVRIWDYTTLATLRTFGDHAIEGAVAALAFSAFTPNYLASTDEGMQKTIALWDWTNGKLLADAKSTDTVYALDFNPSNGQLVSAGVQHVNFWTIKNQEHGKPSHALSHKSGLFHTHARPKAVLSIAFTTSGDTVTGDSNGTIFVFSAVKDTYEVTKAIVNAHADAVFSIISTPGGYISAGRDGIVKAWGQDLTPQHGTQVVNVSEPVRCVATTIASSLDLANVLVGTHNNELYVVNLTTGTSRAVMKAHSGEIWGLSTNDANIFVTSGKDSHVCAWNPASKTLVWQITLPNKAVSNTVDIDTHSDLIAVGTDTGNIEFYDKKGNHQRSLHVATKGVAVVKFSPDGSHLAVGARDSVLYVVNVATSGIRTFKGHSGAVMQVDWSVDGHYVQSSSIDYELLYWEVATGQRNGIISETRDFEWATQTAILGWSVKGIWPRGADGTDVNALDRSHNKKLVVTGDDFSLVKLFKSPCYIEHSEGKASQGHSAHVTNVRFLP